MKLFLQLTFRQLYYFLINKKQRQFVKIAFRYGNKKRYHKIEVKFNGFRITAVDSLSFVWQYKDIFTDEIYFFESKSNPQPFILDCGANIGTSCLYFKTIYPQARIVAYEADPDIAKVLKDNLRKNKIDDVEVINKAIWINNESMDLCPDGADGATVFGNTEKIKVDAVRLKDILMKETNIDLLKMDIEGAENEVIIDCKEMLSSAKNIFIEYHSFYDNKQKLGDILNVLSENNFRYYIQAVEERKCPFVNKNARNNNTMDLQLNIFAFK